MSVLNLCVKGTRAQAEGSANRRGIPFNFIRETAGGETLGTCPDHFEQAVIDWFNENPNARAPYPIGELLFWSHIGRV